jgi:hypothetical protein
MAELKDWRTRGLENCRIERLMNERTGVTKYIFIKSTKCMFPRRNWDLPTSSPASECAPLPEPKGGGGHTRLRVRGWGSPNSDDWRTSLTLCILCDLITGWCEDEGIKELED